jgi:ABC-type glycerol-3-phosphate transport system substrate-binding protein
MEQALALVEFLAEASFLAEWNTAIGHLPPRPDALAGWTVGSSEFSSQLRQLAADLSTAASLQPSEDILAVLGPPIRQAVISVLNQQVEPDVAAHAAAANLNLP